MDPGDRHIAETIDRLRADLAASQHAYLDVADALLPSSTGAVDLVAEARRLRGVEREAEALRAEVAARSGDLARLADEVKRCQEIIASLVANNCEVDEEDREHSPEHAPLDSMANSTNNTAIRYLGEIGKVAIIGSAGRRIWARWNP